MKRGSLLRSDGLLREPKNRSAFIAQPAPPVVDEPGSRWMHVADPITVLPNEHFCVANIR
jgi:hypothetical protein